MRLNIHVVLVGLCLAGSASAETLVVTSPDGSYKPGLASSWKQEGDRVVIALAANVDAAFVAQQLKEKLPTADIQPAANTLSVKGLPLPALLEQLGKLAVSPSKSEDSLGALAALGAAGGDTQEAGGSIRASKPTLLPAGAFPVESSEFIEATVAEITRGEFPKATLKVKIRTVPKANPHKSQLKYGQTIEASVAESNAAVGAAYFAKSGDRVQIRLMTPASTEAAWVLVGFDRK